MLIDCCAFFQENDTFLLRYSTLSPYVDKFVVLEARESHRGTPRALEFAHAHLPNVRYIVLDSYNIMGNDDASAEKRDWYGRDYLTYYCGALSNDLVMLSDLDEIPNLAPLDMNQIQQIASYDNVFVFEQYLSYYYINWRTNYKWYGTKLAMRKSFNQLGDIRRMHKDQCIVIPDGGWHASYLGGVGAIQKKLENFCHADMVAGSNNIENILMSIAQGKDLFNRGETFTPEYIDTTYPPAIMEFPQFIGTTL